MDATQSLAPALPKRGVGAWSAGIAAGVLVHVLFGVTVWFLFWYLKDGREPTPHGSLLLDAMLAVLFAVPHSVLLLPAVKQRLTAIIPAAFYGLFFTAVTSLSLLVLFRYWQGVSGQIWELRGWARAAMVAGFYGSWAALFYSLHLTGLGFQTGLTPWLAWLRREQPPRRAFAPRGAYRLVRHPVYLSFMGLVWFTPHMSADHAVLTAIWTVYLFIGSWLKDRRLEHFLRDEYRDYERRVPGYPFVFAGPLGKHHAA